MTTTAEIASDQELITNAKYIMGQYGLSQNAAAKEIGVSQTTYSQWLRDIYPADLDEVEGKIRTWIANRTIRKTVQKTLPQVPEYFETPSSKRMTAALTYAQMAADLVVIYGGAGVSKTTTLRHYAEQNPNVWILEATPCTTTMGGFLRTLAYTVDVRVPKGHSDRLEIALRKRLVNTNGLLIVDEAQFLNERALEVARRITEMTGIGLAFAGNEAIYTQLTGHNRSAEFAQLFSRIGKKVKLTRPTDGDITAFCDAWQLDDSSRTLIKTIAKKPGALRMATKTLRLATMMAQANDSGLTASHVKAAWDDLGGN